MDGTFKLRTKSTIEFLRLAWLIITEGEERAQFLSVCKNGTLSELFILIYAKLFSIKYFNSQKHYCKSQN